MYGSVAWAPTVQNNNHWGTTLLLGVSLLNDDDEDHSSVFLAPEVQLLTSYKVFPLLMLEAGGGLQKWMTADGKTNPTLTANIHYRFQGFLGPIDTFFIGYSALWEIVTHKQVRIGIQVKL